MSRIWWQRSGGLWVSVVVGLRHGGCGFRLWWVYSGWGVVSHGGAVVAWGYGLWVCLVVEYVFFFFFFLLVVAWFLWPMSGGFCVCLCVCFFLLVSLVGGFGGFF